MCIILFSYKTHPDYKLVLISNRDEFYNRPTSQLSKWNNETEIYAGKDEQSGGTWMGINDNGNFAALTNYRDLSSIKQDAPSRGLLVSNYLTNSKAPLDYLNEIKPLAKEYNGYNLLVGSIDELYFYSNIEDKIIKVEPGFHGLSNKFLNTPWPKVERGKQKIREITQLNKNISTDKLFELLGDQTKAPDEMLPDTGVGIEWERILSPIFINSPIYGTRASSILTIDKNDKVSFTERTFIKLKSGEFETKTVSFKF